MISLSSLALSSLLLLSEVLSTDIHATDDWITQSWYFNWNPPGVDPTISIPHTAQCDSLNINWQRATGSVPDFQPPFYLRIFTSTFPAPIVVDAGSDLNFTFVVPFPPDTQYQICMTDSKGNSGGCQASYTVFRNDNITLNSAKNIVRAPPSCANITYPPSDRLLNVTGTTVNGPLTSMAWADQCTDISLLPHNGVPPYILTVAPAYHPPMNISFHSEGPLNWTVTLGWAHQFYLSLVDANGLTWATGPLHSGGNGLTNCLVLGGNSLGVRAKLHDSSVGISGGRLAGVMIGSLVAGILLGIIAFGLIVRMRRRREGSKMNAGFVDPYPPTEPLPSGSEIEDTLSARSTSPILNSPRTVPSSIMRQLSDASSQQQQVYVVHHDGGRPPISVYHPEGAQVVEFPPVYGPNSPIQQQNEVTPSSTRRQKSRIPPKDTANGTSG